MNGWSEWNTIGRHGVRVGTEVHRQARGRAALPDITALALPESKGTASAAHSELENASHPAAYYDRFLGDDVALGEISLAESGILLHRRLLALLGLGHARVQRQIRTIRLLVMNMMLYPIEHELSVAQVLCGEAAAFRLPCGVQIWIGHHLGEGKLLAWILRILMQKRRRLRQWSVGGCLEAFEEFFLRLAVIVVVLFFVQHSFNMEPILIGAHLIQKGASLALLQLPLHFPGDVVQRCELVETHDMNLTVRMHGAVLLMLVAQLQRYGSAEAASRRSHVAAE